MEYLINFDELMTRGGPIMWVIFFTAWLAIILLVERGLQIHAWLRQANKDQQLLTADPYYKPDKRSARRNSPVAQLLHHLNWNDIHSKEDLAKHINIRLTEIMPKLEGMLPTIAVLGSLLPMLGLLGTVVGMIDVFEVIALHGTGNPQEMANGISQALLTTASGLIIAIPVIFFHHLLVGRLQYLMGITKQSVLVVYAREFPAQSQDSSNDTPAEDEDAKA